MVAACDGVASVRSAPDNTASMHAAVNRTKQHTLLLMEGNTQVGAERKNGNQIKVG
jgi:hypothetical protein